ncbi:hypothetical protein SNEBB_001800 [Seison nebaliae]|nr:hypothetical protein SNEBB_001800 [Seison nebaliae]
MILSSFVSFKLSEIFNHSLSIDSMELFRCRVIGRSYPLIQITSIHSSFPRHKTCCPICSICSLGKQIGEESLNVTYGMRGRMTLPTTNDEHSNNYPIYLEIY